MNDDRLTWGEFLLLLGVLSPGIIALVGLIGLPGCPEAAGCC